MRLALPVLSACLFPAAFLGICRAQDSASTWQGEWGVFAHTASKAESPRLAGAGLSITQCANGTCKFSVLVQEWNGANGEGSGNLTIQSDNAALATMQPIADYHCSLHLVRSSTEPPVITLAPTADAQGAGCSNFLTPGATFVHTFPLRSAAPFYGNDLPACFADTGPARQALCTRQELATLENKWMLLSYTTADLQNRHADIPAALAGMLKKCDGDANPAVCLNTAFDAALSTMNTADAHWLESVTAPGDAAEAAHKSAAIAGVYRRSFESGDVQGDSFRVTDTLRIEPTSGSSIRYSLHLNFFNGHECSRKGTASYRLAGLFAGQDKLDPSAYKNAAPYGDLCVFELIPTDTGVQLRDPTGACRLSDCGERGGYNGTAFTFAEQTPAER